MGISKWDVSLIVACSEMKIETNVYPLNVMEWIQHIVINFQNAFVF